MELIDTHAHLYLNNFINDQKEIINNALTNNVKKIILPNIDSNSLPLLQKMVSDYRGICYPLLGLHPTSVNENYKEEIKSVFSDFDTKKYYGIGETGIDLYWDKTYYNEQVAAFRYQTELAISANLPLIIHARDSFKEIFTILDEYKNSGIKGIFHAFTGDKNEADYIISNYKFKLGIGGIVTFKNSQLAKTVSQIPIENIVLETDSPYLSPEPNRGKRNESAYLVFTARKISDIYKVQVEEVASITTQNAIELFNLN